jgi:menaquinone-dependent protoporphyrinogen oxidase
MRVLVTWGSKRGGTEGIARILADALERDGIEVETLPADRASPRGFDAVVVGGALYANRWHADARRFVRRNRRALRRIPVWFFSSGPLDDSAERTTIEPVRQVTALMSRVGARDHVTFGGTLAADATGFPARAMAKTHAGDWRNPDRIRAWADELAAALPTAEPGDVLDVAARSIPRVVACAAATAVLVALVRLATLPLGLGPLAFTLHATIAAAIAIVLGRRYFRPVGAREPAPTAAIVAASAVLLDTLVVRSPFVAVSGAAVFLAVWATGAISAMLPTGAAGSRRPARAARARRAGHRSADTARAPRGRGGSRT